MKPKPDQVAAGIRSSITSSGLIHDATHVVVDAKTSGFLFRRKTEIHAAGRVDTEREKREIDRILETESAGYPVVNTVRVQQR